MRITVERCRAHDRRFRDLRLTTEQGLRTALAGNEFRLHYQPEMRLTDGGVSGFEALIRWHHPDRGLLTPGTFLPVARSAGLIEDIDTWVLKLDQSLTADVARRADAAAVTKAAIDMGHALDLVVLAEGVETAAHHDALQLLDCDCDCDYDCDYDCDWGQGWHLGMPSLPEEPPARLRWQAGTCERAGRGRVG